MKHLCLLLSLSALCAAQEKISTPAEILPPFGGGQGAQLRFDDSTAIQFIGLVASANIPTTVISSATAANPMVLTTASAMTIQPGSVIIIGGATGVGCSGMNGTQSVTTVAGTSVTINFDGTGCAYTASSGGASTAFWILPSADAVGCWYSAGVSALSIDPCAQLNVAQTWTATQTFQLSASNTGHPAILVEQQGSSTDKLQCWANSGVTQEVCFDAAANLINNGGAPNIGASGASFNYGYISYPMVSSLSFMNGVTAEMHVGYNSADCGGLGGVPFVNNISQNLFEVCETGGVDVNTTLNMSGNTVPTTDNSYYLGTTSERWSDVETVNQRVWGDLTIAATSGYAYIDMGTSSQPSLIRTPYWQPAGSNPIAVGCAQWTLGVLGALTSACAVAPGAWSSYTCTVTGLATVSSKDCEYSSFGKATYLRFSIVGTGSGSSAMTVSLPAAVKNTDEVFVVCITGASCAPWFPSGSTAITSPAAVPAFSYTWSFTGLYESN